LHRLSHVFYNGLNHTLPSSLSKKQTLVSQLAAYNPLVKKITFRATVKNIAKTKISIRDKEALLRAREKYLLFTSTKLLFLVSRFTLYWRRVVSLLIWRQVVGKNHTLPYLEAGVKIVFWSLRWLRKLAAAKRRRRLLRFHLKRKTWLSLLNKIGFNFFEKIDELEVRKKVREWFIPQVIYTLKKQKGRLRWLNEYYPRLYSLYLEDSWKYAVLAPKRQKAYSIQPMRSGKAARAMLLATTKADFRIVTNRLYGLFKMSSRRYVRKAITPKFLGVFYRKLRQIQTTGTKNWPAHFAAATHEKQRKLVVTELKTARFDYFFKIGRRLLSALDSAALNTSANQEQDKKGVSNAANLSRVENLPVHGYGSRQAGLRWSPLFRPFFSRFFSTRAQAISTESAVFLTSKLERFKMQHTKYVIVDECSANPAKRPFVQFRVIRKKALRKFQIVTKFRTSRQRSVRSQEYLFRLSAVRNPTVKIFKRRRQLRPLEKKAFNFLLMPAINNDIVEDTNYTHANTSFLTAGLNQADTAQAGSEKRNVVKVETKTVYNRGGQPRTQSAYRALNRRVNRPFSALFGRFSHGWLPRPTRFTNKYKFLGKLGLNRKKRRLPWARRRRRAIRAYMRWVKRCLIPEKKVLKILVWQRLFEKHRSQIIADIKAILEELEETRSELIRLELLDVFAGPLNYKLIRLRDKKTLVPWKESRLITVLEPKTKRGRFVIERFRALRKKTNQPKKILAALDLKLQKVRKTLYNNLVWKQRKLIKRSVKKKLAKRAKIHKKRIYSVFKWASRLTLYRKKKMYAALKLQHKLKNRRKERVLRQALRLLKRRSGVSKLHNLFHPKITRKKTTWVKKKYRRVRRIARKKFFARQRRVIQNRLEKQKWTYKVVPAMWNRRWRRITLPYFKKFRVLKKMLHHMNYEFMKSSHYLKKVSAGLHFIRKKKLSLSWSQLKNVDLSTLYQMQLYTDYHSKYAALSYKFFSFLDASERRRLKECFALARVQHNWSEIPFSTKGYVGFIFGAIKAFSNHAIRRLLAVKSKSPASNFFKIAATLALIYTKNFIKLKNNKFKNATRLQLVHKRAKTALISAAPSLATLKPLFYARRSELSKLKFSGLALRLLEELAMAWFTKIRDAHNLNFSLKVKKAANRVRSPRRHLFKCLLFLSRWSNARRHKRNKLPHVDRGELVSSSWKPRLILKKRQAKLANVRSEFTGMNKFEKIEKNYDRYRQERTWSRVLVWRIPDYKFERSDMRSAFRFNYRERLHFKWVEALLYTRVAYHTSRRYMFRRYNIPREQKRLKKLQKFRKAWGGGPSKHIQAVRKQGRKVRGRWRGFINRLFKKLFSFPTFKNAKKHFQRQIKKRPKTHDRSLNFSETANRASVVLILLGVIPTIYWSKILVKAGFIAVNDKVISEHDYLIHPGDIIKLNWKKISACQKIFQSPQFWSQYRTYKHKLAIASTWPKNFEYNWKFDYIRYLRYPKPTDNPRGSQLNFTMFEDFRLDVGAGLYY
jgi:hypothetical protein